MINLLFDIYVLWFMFGVAALAISVGVIAVAEYVREKKWGLQYESHGKI